MQYRRRDDQTCKMLTILVFIANLAFLAFLSYQLGRRENIGDRQLFWPALIFKLTCGIALGLLYTYYYTTGDTFSFFQDGSTLSNLARRDFIEYIRFLGLADDSFSVWTELNHQQYRSLFFSKWISVVNLITYDNYWVTSIYFSFLSFLGAWYLWKSIISFFEGSYAPAAFAFLFFPSVVFWTSGLIKEAVAMPGLYFLAAAFLRLWHNRRLVLVEWILLMVSLWCVWQLKYFYLALFVPIALTTWVVKYLSTVVFVFRRIVMQFFAWVALFGLCLLTVNFLHPNFDFDYLPEVIVHNNTAYTRLSRPDNLISFPELEPNYASLLTHSPKALVTGLFRPYIWEGGMLIKLMSGIENLILMVVIGTSLVSSKYKPRSDYSLLAFATLVYCILLCILLTLSTPNLGTLVRYRVGFLPFLVFLTLYRNNCLDAIAKNFQRFFYRLVRKT